MAKTRGITQTYPEYSEILKKEIVEACGDPDWSWVAAAQEVDFIGVDVEETSVW